MSRKHPASYMLRKKHAKQLQIKHAPAQETGRQQEEALPAGTEQQAQIEEYTPETVEEDRMTEQVVQDETLLQEEETVQEAAAEEGSAENCADAGMYLELDVNALDNMAMSFLEGAEAEFTYHQAELIRLAYLGLKTKNAIEAAQFVLDRARNLAPHRPKARTIDDPLNEYISDFVEQESGHLSYVEAEIIRRAARGCDSESIDELQYLLNRALRALNERTASAS